MKKKNLLLIGIIVGFALFSTYFGAGNLIFPPYIGIMTGDKWPLGLLGLTFSAIFLPIIAVVAVFNAGGNPDNMMRAVGKNFKIFFLFVNYTFLALGSTIPRTAATTYEMAVLPNFPQVPIVASSLVFFIIFYFLVRKKESVVDKLGKILTPALLIILIFIVLNVFFRPIGTPASSSTENPFVDSLLQGYLTGDLTLGILISAMFIDALKKEGLDHKETRKGLYIACITAFLGLFIVYAGLLFGGASISQDFNLDSERTLLLREITLRATGRPGLIALAIAVALACLTTAVGIAANVASFLEDLTKGKISYSIWVLVIAVLGFFLSIKGVTQLIDYVTPLFSFLYPIFTVLTVLGLFDKFIANDGIYKGAVLLSAIFGLLDALVIVTGSQSLKAFVNFFPLGNLGFAWIIPSVIAMIVGYFIFKGKPRVQKIAE